MKDLSPHICAIIVAAGRGMRAGGLKNGPKQYRMIGQRPVITHAVAEFTAHPKIKHILIVHHKDDRALLDNAIAPLDQANLSFCVGGETRQSSVHAGLEQLKAHKPDFVLIHDGVRPFINQAFLTDMIEEIDESRIALLPALPVSSTLKMANASHHVEKTIGRDRLFAAQTPQAFPFQDILTGHQKAAHVGRCDFTDDCAIAEWMGQTVKIIAGQQQNIKLTTQEDLIMANEILSKNAHRTPITDVRTGNGYDVHQLVAGDGVILCGVKIPHDKKLAGHSDADVALHALTDALLATCGAGDIGDHFPPSDAKWKGASSDIFLKKAVEIVTEHGGTITNADISIIAEQPKIGPHRQNLRENLSKILAIDLERCSIKATTNEKIGFIGREEGIAAIATATVVYG